MDYRATAIRWTVLLSAAGLFAFAVLTNLDAHFAQQAIENQEDFSAYRAANGPR